MDSEEVTDPKKGGAEYVVSPWALMWDDENYYLVGVVIDRFGTDVMIFPQDEEHFRASVTVSVSPQFFGWLAGLGKGIRIHWPEDVREEYKTYLQGIIENT